MASRQATTVDNTAIRVALWRALHLEVDEPPHVFHDTIGLQLVAPAEDWRQRPDMNAWNTMLFRASIIARARYVEDLLLEQVARGVSQYVILGAGLDTFCVRRPEFASKLRIFEIDQPGTQAWKQQRLGEIGFAITGSPIFVPVDFEAGDRWLDKLSAVGFDSSKPVFVASTGVSLYLTREGIMATLRQIAALAPGSTLAMTYNLPLELADDEERPGIEMAVKGARAAGTPFVSFFTSEEIKSMACDAGFKTANHVSAAELAKRYFAYRKDGFHPPKSEEFLIATT